MIALIQLVSDACVTIDGTVSGRIGRGLLVLLGVARGDTAAEADRLLERILTYRIFPDDQGRMNRSVLDVGGGLLVVSQFTLVADTAKGTRPGFSKGAAPIQAAAAPPVTTDTPPAGEGNARSHA